jgi:hypothetical protein
MSDQLGGLPARLLPDRIIATGFMPGTSVDGDQIAGSTRSLRIELERAVHSFHLVWPR